MDNRIQKIIDDLYEIDGGLREYESEVKEIIEKLLVSRPDTKFDKEFAYNLRTELLERATQLKEQGEDRRPQKISFSFNFMDSILNSPQVSKLKYVGAGIVICLLIAIPIISQLNKSGVFLGKPSLELARVSTINQLGNRAFGSLLAGEDQVSFSGGRDSDMAESSAMVQAPEPVSGKGIGGGGGMGLPAPESVSYKFIYKGEEIILDQNEMKVFKRVVGSKAGSQLGSLISSLNFGLADLSSFSGAELENVSLAEEKDFGYMIYVNLDEEMISVNQNWVYWPRYDPSVEGLGLDEVPSDEDLIEAADRFLQDRNIDISFYDEPVVRDDWRVYWEQAKEGGEGYIPEEVQVIYPLIVSNKEVYEEQGYKSGLAVGINIRHNRVAGVWGLSTQNYQTSDYEIETDWGKIISLAEQGGRYFWSAPGASQTVEVELNTPFISLMRHWRYEQTRDKSEELLVPAMIFPIKEIPEGADFYREAIVVPLVKELLEENGDRPVLMEEAIR